MKQPLIEQKDYGENGMDQLERQYETMKKNDPTLISNEQKLDFKKRTRKAASQILNFEFKETIVNRVINESGRL